MIKSPKNKKKLEKCKLSYATIHVHKDLNIIFFSSTTEVSQSSKSPNLQNCLHSALSKCTKLNTKEPTSKVPKCYSFSPNPSNSLTSL